MERRRPVCRARVVLLDGGRVLLAHHAHPDGRDFWCFPGGGVEPGESFAAAARRELAEEAGLEVELQGLLCAQDFPGGDAFELIFLARPAGGAVRLGGDPERDGDVPVLRDLEWVSLDHLALRHVLPQSLALRLSSRDLRTVPFSEA